jgi:uncharacterized membrane protein YuzA (DUF378 family)
MDTQEYNRGYWKAKVHMICMALVLVGAINWGTTAFGYNLVDISSNWLNQTSGLILQADKFIYILVAISAIYLAIRRDTWLPFLGYSVLPDQLVSLKENKDANINVQVKVRPNSKVAYWASKPENKEDTIPEVLTAYGSFENSGVVMSDANGIAILPIKESTKYKVPSGRVLERHVHYRVLGLPWGMVGRIQTVYY